MNKTSTTVNSGISFSGLLTVAFIVLKLCNVIQWSWWWVLAPTWIPLAFVVVVLLICGILKLIAAIHKRRWKKRIERIYGSGK